MSELEFGEYRFARPESIVMPRVTFQKSGQLAVNDAGRNALGWTGVDRPQYVELLWDRTQRAIAIVPRS